jgi:hypothetical protein
MAPSTTETRLTAVPELECSVSSHTSSHGEFDDSVDRGQASPRNTEPR